jgi:signal transduction protein with GAF and PtsI domain
VAFKLKDLEQRLERTEQQLQLLQKISRILSREIPLPDALQAIVSLVVEFMVCDSCLLYLREQSRLVLCATNNPRSAGIGRVALQMSEGLTGWVAREKRLLSISREAYADPRFKFFSDLPEDTFEAFLSAPIILRGRVVGVINVQHRRPHSHTGGEMELLTTIGELAGGLLAVARLDSNVELTASDLLMSPISPASRA